MELLTLKSGNLICQIAPEMGGAIYSFSYKAKGKTQPLMRPTPSTDSHLITDFSSWPLVPFSNRINKGRFSWGGKDYKVPVTWLGPPHHASHGHGWEHAWDVKSHTPTRCEMVFAFDDKRHWPFPYKARQIFQLDNDALYIKLSVTNAGKAPMPAGLGLHPYFPRTKGTTLQAKTKGLWEIDKDTIPSKRIPVPAKFDFTEPKKLDKVRLDHCFDGYGHEMEIVWPNQPVKLQVSSSDNLNHFVVYTAKEPDDFFCAEPVSHMPDAINRPKLKTGLVTLAPGETMNATYRFGISPA